MTTMAIRNRRQDFALLVPQLLGINRLPKGQGGGNLHGQWDQPQQDQRMRLASGRAVAKTLLKASRCSLAGLLT